MTFHRQTSLAFQRTADLKNEVKALRAQNVCLLHKGQMANTKAMRYLEDMHAAELYLCSLKEELFKLRSEHLDPPQSFSQCDSGYSDSHFCFNERLFPTDLKFLGMKSAPQTPLRDTANSYLTSPPSVSKKMLNN